MNVVNSVAGIRRKTTADDFQIIRHGQYKVPRVQSCQSTKNLISNSRSKNETNDNSIMHSRLVCRNDYLARLEENNDSTLGIGSICLPSSSSMFQQTDHTQLNFKISSQEKNNKNFVPEYDIGQRVADFVKNNNSPRRLNKLAPSSTNSTSTSTESNRREKSNNVRKSDSKGETNNSVILALTEGRGLAQGEIGLATIDIKRPVLILCQFSDNQTYMNTINKINILNPAEILVPSTFMDQVKGTLYETLKSQFPLSSILSASRNLFCQNEGELYLKNSVVPECVSKLKLVLPKYYAVSAAAALFKYIEFNHNVMFSSNSLQIEYEGIEKSMFVDVNTALQLELVLNSSFNTKNTLYDVLNFCTTVGGQRRLRSFILQPSSDIQLIHDHQEAIKEILCNRDRFIIFKNVIKNFTDAEKLYWLCTKVSKNTQSLSKLQGNYTLLLKTTLEALPLLVDTIKPFKSKYISNICKTLLNSEYTKMLEIIEITINKESTRSKGFAQTQFHRCFAIKSNLNPLLDVARTVYNELIRDFYEKVKLLGEHLGIECLVPTNSRNRGFHVQVDVKNIKNFDIKHPPSTIKHVECVKNTIKFTTEDLLVLNIRITQTLNEVEMLTNAMLFEMFNELKKYISCIHNMCNSVADLDLIFSFAEYSMRSGLVRPVFGQCINIENSRHPILDDLMHSTALVANNIFASTDKNLNIITGPNMGGKSIFIRQVALLQIIAQLGCFVPATKAEFRICDRLFTRIGFGDSVESNLSTFVLEIKELNAILPSLTNHSLVIIDELCRATSSEEGSSLAWAVSEYIMQSRAFIFLATHSILITKLQDLYCNVVNYHMEALPARDSVDTLTFTYKLRLGVTNISNYGLALAREVKMPDNLIEYAIEIQKHLPQTKIVLADNPLNEAGLILDNCIQKLLKLKDDDCLDMSEIQSVLLEMMNELQENRMTNIDLSTESVDSDEEILAERLPDDDN